MYTLLTLVFVLVLSVLALAQRHPPPPTIAEFAPQAVEQITDAPDDHSSSSGRSRGAGGESGSGVQEPTPAPSALINAPRVRRCVGDPPRQIEDPQSPPCVPYWQGDNGGATYKGVTRDQITIAAPEMDGYYPRYAAFFNSRFEFYGRKLNFVDPNPNDPTDPAGQRAVAVRADEEYHVFGSTNYNGSLGFHYYEELGRRGIVAAASYSTLTDRIMTELHPNLWSYPMSTDGIFANIGEWACKRLAHANAVHAGDPLMQGKPRVFGVVLQRSNDSPITSKPLEDELAACGARPALVTDDTSSNTIIRMRQANVSSLICLCIYVTSGLMNRYATAQAWFPEWLVSTYSLQDKNFWLKGFWSSEHLEHTFGLTFEPKQVPFDQDPARWAQLEGSNGAGQESYNDTSLYRGAAAHREYRSILLLAAGIQMAGPRLTPQTFAAGLQRTRFPNPDHPLVPGKVGFDSPVDHSMTNDAAEWWWSNDDRGPYGDDKAGTICYVDHGARRVKGAYPQGGDPFFQPPCDSSAPPIT